MRAGVTMRDPSTVYLDADGRARRGRDARAERRSCAAATTVGEGTHDRRRAARSSTARSARAASSGRASSRRSIVEDGRRSARSPTSGRARIVGRGRRGRQLRRAEEHPPRAGREAAPRQLPRRRGVWAPGRTSAPARSPRTTTGRSKHRTTIGERVFLGVDTMLRAPVDARRRRADRCRRGRHEGRPGRQARGRRAGPDPRAAPETGRRLGRRHRASRTTAGS